MTFFNYKLVTSRNLLSLIIKSILFSFLQFPAINLTILGSQPVRHFLRPVVHLAAMRTDSCRDERNLEDQGGQHTKKHQRHSWARNNLDTLRGLNTLVTVNLKLQGNTNTRSSPAPSLFNRHWNVSPTSNVAPFCVTFDSDCNSAL